MSLSSVDSVIILEPEDANDRETLGSPVPNFLVDPSSHTRAEVDNEDLAAHQQEEEQEEQEPELFILEDDSEAVDPQDQILLDDWSWRVVYSPTPPATPWPLNRTIELDLSVSPEQGPLGLHPALQCPVCLDSFQAIIERG